MALRRPIGKHLDRELGLLSVYAISVGAMMGSGIFVLPGLAANLAGPMVCISYLLAGLLVLPATLSKAELATAMPVAGGTYVYIERSLGPLAGTISGLGTWFALSAKTAFAVVGLGGYLAIFYPRGMVTLGSTLLLLLLLVNALGAGKAARLQVVVVLLSATALLIFAAAGGSQANPALQQPPFPMGASGILAGAGFVFVSYNGVTKVCSVAEEIKNPQRNIPLGMLAALFSMMILYSGLTWMLTALLPWSELSQDITPMASAAAVLGPFPRLAIAAIAIMALLSMTNAGILASTRYPFAMSRDQLMPGFLKGISRRFGTPLPSIALTGLLLLGLVHFVPIAKLAKLASGFTIFIFLVENLALIVLRETGPHWYRPSFKSPFYPWTQILGMVGCAAVLISLGPLALSGVGAGLVLGTLWYAAYGRTRTTRLSAFAHLWGEVHAFEASESDEHDSSVRQAQVLVPVFGHEPAPNRLVRLAASFAEGAPMEILHLDEVPETVNLATELEDRELTRDLTRQGEILAEELGVDIELRDLITHNAKRALTLEAQRTKAHWLVMEWPSRGDLHYIIRHPMAWWLDHPPCDLAIFLDKSPGPGPLDFQHILVLAEPGPYDSLVVHVADRLAQQERADLTLVALVDSPAGTQDAQLYLQEMTELTHVPVQTRVELRQNEAGQIQCICEDADLLVLGAPPEHGWRSVFKGGREHRLAQAASCSVLRIKEPRHSLHHSLLLPAWLGRSPYTLEPVLEEASLMARYVVRDKAHLFERMARRMSRALPESDAPAIEAALWERERVQNTAVPGGLAILDATVPGLTQRHLGVFHLDRLLDFRSPERRKVDLCFVVLGSPGQRGGQLRMVERLRSLTSNPQLLSTLRACRDGSELREALLEAEEELLEG